MYVYDDDGNINSNLTGTCSISLHIHILNSFRIGKKRPQILVTTESNVTSPFHLANNNNNNRKL